MLLQASWLLHATWLLHDYLLQLWVTNEVEDESNVATNLFGGGTSYTVLAGYSMSLLGCCMPAGFCLIVCYGCGGTGGRG